MKKSMGVLGAAFLGLGMAVAMPAFAQDEIVELTQQDKEMIGLLTKYNSCVGDRLAGALQRENVPDDLFERMVTRKNATIAELKGKDPKMPEEVINLVLGLELAGMVQKWAEETCGAETPIDWPAVKSRFEEIQTQPAYKKKLYKELYDIDIN